MADWLETIQQTGSTLLNATTDAAAARIKSELGPQAPSAPASRPETQYDTNIQQPVDGPEANKPATGVSATVGQVWGQYKWWIAGGLAITGYLYLKG
ncbi:MAG: hypothetical protein R3303_05680 [Marinobacter sp.]|nr:hypothetical protein [Marinobacter sp.]